MSDAASLNVPALVAALRDGTYTKTDLLLAASQLETERSESTQPASMVDAPGFDVWLEMPYTKVLMKSTKRDYVPKWDVPRAFVSGADHALDLLVAAGNITRETAFQARDIAKEAAALLMECQDERLSAKKPPQASENA